MSDPGWCCVQRGAAGLWLLWSGSPRAVDTARWPECESGEPASFWVLGPAAPLVSFFPSFLLFFSFHCPSVLHALSALGARECPFPPLPRSQWLSNPSGWVLKAPWAQSWGTSFERCPS